MRSGYGRGAQAFHWITVALLTALVALGLYCSWVGDGPVRSYLLDSWHKPLGLVVIVLTLVRLGWKATRPGVADAEGLERWEAGLSRITHGALYAVILAMALSGLLMAQGAGRPTSFFGLFASAHSARSRCRSGTPAPARRRSWLRCRAASPAR